MVAFPNKFSQELHIAVAVGIEVEIILESLLNLVKVVFYALLRQFSIIFQLKLKLMGSPFIFQVENLFNYVADLLKVFYACSLSLS